MNPMFVNPPAPIDGFDPTDRRWYVLGCKTCADIPVGVGASNIYDPWQIAGETSDAPNGSNDLNVGDYATPLDPSTDPSIYNFSTQPGHCWPFMSLSATSRSTGMSSPSIISAGGYYPSNNDKEGINHYRRFVRLAPRMFGSGGRKIIHTMSGLMLSSHANSVLDVVFQHDLVTSVDGAGNNTTTFDSNKRFGFRFHMGNLGASERAFRLEIVGHAMGPRKSVWTGHLLIAGSNPEEDAPALDQHRGPKYVNLSSGPDMDTEGSMLAFLYAARRHTGIGLYDIGTAGSAAQNGSEVYCKVGAALTLLSPGH